MKSWWNSCHQIAKKMHFWHSFWLQKHSLYIVDEHDCFFSENLRIPPFYQICLYFFVCSGSNVCWNFRVLWGVLKSSQERYIQFASMRVCRYLSQSGKSFKGFSQKDIHEEIEFHNSVQDLVFTTVYRL